MKLKKNKILDALKTVNDPDLKKDLVSLGMIENVRINNNTVTFDIVLTTPSCPLKNQIKQDCINAVKKFAGNDVVVEPNLTAKVTKKQNPANLDKIDLPDIKNIIAVVSGKGGVGKSTVAANLAVTLASQGAKVGLIDADIYGPSMPIMFDLTDDKPEIAEIKGKNVMFPLEQYGVKLMSIGFIVDPDKALIWRGPMASNAMKQLITDTHWGELDYLIIDTPPGTGDIHLTLIQNFHVAGVAIVTTPQNVALADAEKAISLFRQDLIKVPVLGIIENMSYFTPAELPDNKYYIFGKNGGKKFAEKYKIPLLGAIPLVASICESGDNGKPESLVKNSVTGKAFLELAGELSRQISIWNTFKEITDVKSCK